MGGMIAAFVLLMQAGRAQAAPPAEIDGTWEVEHVKNDGQGGVSCTFRTDDPALVGRTLVITGESVQFKDGKKIGCAQQSWTPRRATWGVLFGKGFPRSATGGRSATPTPRDFKMKVSPTDQATTYSLCPRPDGKGAPFPRDYWVAAAGDRLLLHYDTSTLLVLRPRPTAPTASFSCQKATTPTEKAICGSHDLASWDRSVNLAFHQALAKLDATEAASLRSEQKAWVRERDRCGADVACIDEKQKSRVQDIPYPWGCNE